MQPIPRIYESQVQFCGHHLDHAYDLYQCVPCQTFKVENTRTDVWRNAVRYRFFSILHSLLSTYIHAPIVSLSRLYINLHGYEFQQITQNAHSGDGSTSSCALYDQGSCAVPFSMEHDNVI